MEDEAFWRDIINSLDVEFPTRGKRKPQSESIPVNQKEADVVRLTFDMYLLTPIEEEGKVYLVNANQKMEMCGTMTIQDALEMIKRRKR